jgi:hypothetical protein
MNADGMTTVPAWWQTSRVEDDRASQWVMKARALAAPLILEAGSVADPAPVVPCRVESPADALFGNFMVAWLEPATMPRQVRHLPDGAFFLQVLRRAYAPALTRRPELAVLLKDESRLEMSLTNDVLQIQLHPLTEGYSMIRHHSLMLFCAALWLEEPWRGQWLDLYDELVDQVDSLPGGRPSLARVTEVEAACFEAFVDLAPQTLQPADAADLLHQPDRLSDVLAYQAFAGAAIGLLWREYRSVPPSGRAAWLARQLSHGYVQPDYLEKNWTDQQ